MNALRRTWGARTGRALALVAVCLLALELTLQAASLGLRAVTGRAPHDSLAQDAIRILCVGDSHTYGLPLTAAESYPAQLQTALEKRHPGARFAVANLGIPGVNSAFVANRLERQLLQLRPHLAIVWVGMNNQWNAIESEAWRGESPWQAARRVLLHSKIFRFASIAWYTHTGHQYDPGERGGWFEGETPPSGRRQLAAEPMSAPGLAGDLERMAAIASALGTPLVFLTYPMRHQRPVNDVIELTAQRLAIPVIDTGRDRARALADGYEIIELIDRRAGPHPSALLYRYVVGSLLPAVEESLSDPLAQRARSRPRAP